MFTVFIPVRYTRLLVSSGGRMDPLPGNPATLRTNCPGVIFPNIRVKPKGSGAKNMAAPIRTALAVHRSLLERRIWPGVR